jgi:hypothetical protein
MIHAARGSSVIDFRWIVVVSAPAQDEQVDDAHQSKHAQGDQKRNRHMPPDFRASE